MTEQTTRVGAAVAQGPADLGAHLDCFPVPVNRGTVPAEDRS
ncbi:hypothetical protein ABNF97_32405 [Plantactinospora sp. B6F1]